MQVVLKRFIKAIYYFLALSCAFFSPFIWGYYRTESLYKVSQGSTTPTLGGASYAYADAPSNSGDVGDVGDAGGYSGGSGGNNGDGDSSGGEGDSGGGGGGEGEGGCGGD